MTEKQLSIFPPSLRSEARIIGDELLWPRLHVARALSYVARASLVVLGYDIVSFPKGSKPSVNGQSSYEMDSELTSKAWEEVVVRSLELALRDLNRTRELTGLHPPYDDIWYSIDIISREEAANIKPFAMEVRVPLRNSPSIKAFLESWDKANLGNIDL